MAATTSYCPENVRLGDHYYISMNPLSPSPSID